MNATKLRTRAAQSVIAVTVAVILMAAWVQTGCQKQLKPAPDPERALIAKGRDLFFNETFNGNGRTCGTCHPAENNFTIDPAFIATLPDDDPLFVAEFTPALKKNFENPVLMRQLGLILENLDGFGDLDNTFVMRGVPHTLALPTSIDSPQGPRTGWSGDGAPGDGTLRSFAVGAVIQHFPKTLNRVVGVDFRLPTDDELDALDAFQRSLGRQQDVTLPLPLKGLVPSRGQEIFLNNALGKCNLCHVNAGATANFGGGNIGNANFNTGVENLPDQPADLTGELNPLDDGFGIPGDGTFNTPPLVESADTGPFFHNNSVETIEGSVAFYNGEAFNNSPSGQVLAGIDPNGVGIRLDATQVVAVAAFLRVLNALENIRVSIDLLEQSLGRRPTAGEDRDELLQRAISETRDSLRVLRGGGLHPDAVAHLKQSKRLIKKAARGFFFKWQRLRKAIEEQEKARALLVESA